MKNLKSKRIFVKYISYGVILLALIFAGSLSFVLSKNIATTKSQVKEVKKVSVVKKLNISPTALPENEIKNQNNKPNNSGIAEDKTSYTVVTTTAPVPTTYTVSTTTTQATQAQNNTTENKVNVSVTGSGSFDVKINDSSNQCDVLTKALEQGKIQSLNMRYDNSLGSNGVYQINGIGKDNSIWWTYKVNGNSPSQGCSYVKANNGDNIEWKYIGS